MLTSAILIETLLRAGPLLIAVAWLAGTTAVAGSLFLARYADFPIVSVGMRLDRPKGSPAAGGLYPQGV
jgi:hypothetical protein